MTSAHLLLQGEFLHASLYFGRLTAVTYDGQILRFDVPRLSESLRSESTGSPSTGLPRAPEATAMPVGDRILITPPSDAEILSLHSYDGMTYFGGDDGLWGLAEQRYAILAGTTDYLHVSDRPALHVDTTFGVGAVAHGDGISVLPLGSSWLAGDFFRPSKDELNLPIDAVTWTHHDLLSRSAQLHHEVIPATFELRSHDHEKHYVFQGLGGPSVREVLDGGQPISAIAPRSYATWDAANDSASLFRKERYGWRTDQSGSDAPKDSRPDFQVVGAVPGRVISLREFKNYLLCELSDRLSAIDMKGEETILLDRSATDIRVYPRSRRYRRIVTAVSQIGVHVLELS